MRVPPDALVTLLFVFLGSQAAGRHWPAEFGSIQREAEEVRAHYHRLEKTSEITRHPCSKTKSSKTAPIFPIPTSSLRKSEKTSQPPSPNSPNGANGMSDMEGKMTRVGARERGQRTSFKSLR